MAEYWDKEQSPYKDMTLPNEQGEEVILIDSKLRHISMPKEFKPVGVIDDHNAETLFFQMPRYFDGVDLKNHTCVIKFINANGKYYEYQVIDKAVEEDFIIFGWQIGKEATARDGVVSFSINFQLIEDDVQIYQWQTTPAQITILKGIKVGGTPTKEENDYIKKLTERFEEMMRRGNYYKDIDAMMLFDGYISPDFSSEIRNYVNDNNYIKNVDKKYSNDIYWSNFMSNSGGMSAGPGITYPSTFLFGLLSGDKDWFDENVYDIYEGIFGRKSIDFVSILGQWEGNSEEYKYVDYKNFSSTDKNNKMCFTLVSYNDNIIVGVKYNARLSNPETFRLEIVGNWVFYQLAAPIIRPLLSTSKLEKMISEIEDDKINGWLPNFIEVPDSGSEYPKYYENGNIYVEQPQSRWRKMSKAIDVRNTSKITFNVEEYHSPHIYIDVFFIDNEFGSIDSSTQLIYHKQHSRGQSFDLDVTNYSYIVVTCDKLAIIKYSSILSNSDLTIKFTDYEEDLNIIKRNGYYSYNLFNYNNSSINVGETKSYNNGTLTVTNVGDGSFIIDGRTPNEIDIPLLKENTYCNLPIGKYKILAFKDKEYNNGQYYYTIGGYNSTIAPRDLHPTLSSDGVYFDVQIDTNTLGRFIITLVGTFDNVMIKPIITSKLLATYDDYVPHNMSNTEITNLINSKTKDYIQGDAINLYNDNFAWGVTIDPYTGGFDFDEDLRVSDFIPVNFKNATITLSYTRFRGSNNPIIIYSYSGNRPGDLIKDNTSATIYESFPQNQGESSITFTTVSLTNFIRIVADDDVENISLLISVPSNIELKERIDSLQMLVNEFQRQLNESFPRLGYTNDPK